MTLRLADVPLYHALLFKPIYLYKHFEFNLQWRHIRALTLQVVGNSVIFQQIGQADNKENIKATYKGPLIQKAFFP